MIDKNTQEELKRKLHETETALEAEIAKLKTPVDMGDDIDSYDEEADEAEEYSGNLGQSEALRERLDNVKLALAKIEKGTYGVCEIDNNPIEEEVLQANPEARYCKEHIKSQ